MFENKEITLQEAIETLVRLDSFIDMALSADDVRTLDDFVKAYCRCKLGIEKYFHVSKKEITNAIIEMKYGNGE